MALAPIAGAPAPRQVLLLKGLVNLCPESLWHKLLWPALAWYSSCRVTRWTLPPATDLEQLFGLEFTSYLKVY